MDVSRRDIGARHGPPVPLYVLTSLSTTLLCAPTAASTAMKIPDPANHDRRCRVCDGTGWEQAAPLKSKANGFDIEYPQLISCTNEFWWQDDPDVDADGYNRTTPVSHQRGRTIAATEYELECRRQGREPDWDMFNAIIGKVG